MLFLSDDEKRVWHSLGSEILEKELPPRNIGDDVRENLTSFFHYYAGTLLAAHGREPLAKQWFAEGAQVEDDGLFSNAFAAAFLERRQNRFIMPDTAFADPRPFVHFAGVPEMKGARERFIRQCGHSMPHFKKPFRIIDIGCGNGALIVMLLTHLQETGKVGDIDEILLIDASPAMVELAENTVRQAYPDVTIRTVNSRIEQISDKIDASYDVALSSLAYHHMPMELKRVHLEKLKPRIDHFVIFELDANNDTPEVHSPELAVSVYQSYGRIIDFVFAHDAPVDVVQACVDCFLMTEAVSLLTQPRGERTDYHMLRSQWRGLFDSILSPAFTCRCDSTAYGDEYLDLFTLHYGR